MGTYGKVYYDFYPNMVGLGGANGLQQSFWARQYNTSNFYDPAIVFRVDHDRQPEYRF